MSGRTSFSITLTRLDSAVRRTAILVLVLSVIPLHAAFAIDQNLDIVPLTEVGGSGVFGDATLIDNGDDTTTVDILVSGVTGGHPAAIRTGTCARPGSVVHNLEPIEKDGTSVTEIDVALSRFLADGPWAVIIRRSDASGAPNIACGTIEAVASSTTSSPAPTRTPTPRATVKTPSQATTTPTPIVTPTATPTDSPIPTPTVNPNLPTCQQFDAWVWSQTVFQQNPDDYAANLDPDGNGIACEMLPLQGFAPAIWTDALPGGLTAVRVTGFYNGDTMQIVFNGQVDVVRLNGVAAPTADQCGYGSAGQFHAFVLNIAPSLTLYVDYATAQRDSEGRLIADVWYDYAGDPYLVNEVMVRNGWAAPAPVEGMERFSAEIDAAAEFAEEHVLGVYFECGGFNLPPGSTPSPEQILQARDRQPNQGQFGPS